MSDVNESDPRSNVQALFSLPPKKCTLLQGSLSFTSLSAVQIYDFHIFLTVYDDLLNKEDDEFSARLWNKEGLFVSIRP